MTRSIEIGVILSKYVKPAFQTQVDFTSNVVFNVKFTEYV
jgi:hypothetical protein